jgi:hypothetical protein
MDNNYKKSLVNKIKNLNNKQAYINIYKILKNNDVKLNINSNGIYFNINNLDDYLIMELEEFINMNKKENQPNEFNNIYC